MDKHTPEQRHKNMQAVKKQGLRNRITAPERTLEQRHSIPKEL